MIIKKIAASKRGFLAAALALGISFYGVAGAVAGERGHPSHWSYEGEAGPAHWGDISKGNEACKGKSQSPINIEGTSEAPLADISFDYKPTKLNIVNNGHTIQVNYDKGSLIKVDGVDYELVQFHFHDPSEHTVGGKSFAMENHLVHKNADGKLAVIGVLIEAGAENAAYKGVFANLPKKADEKKELDVTVSADDLLPKDRAFYTYAGSLTTPPCSEIVTWIVLKTPIQMSKKQINAFKKIIRNNNRPIQPLNGRTVSIKAPAAATK